MLGTIGLGVSTSDDTPPESQTGFGAIRTALTAAFLLALVAGLLYASRYTSLQKRKSAADARSAASVHGLQVMNSPHHSTLFLNIQVHALILKTNLRTAVMPDVPVLLHASSCLKI